MISAVILTKNEEKNITECIESLGFCDEILVIDDNSSDNTKQIAEKTGAKVVSHELENDFSRQRNLGIEKAKGEWVLFIDADERVSKELQKEILDKTSEKIEINGFYIPRVDFFYGKMLQHGETAQIKLLRLAKKGKGEWKGNVHEVWNIEGKTEDLQSPLLHYPHPTIGEFLEEINFYTTLRAKELYTKKVSVSWFELIYYPGGKFLQNYFIRMGYKDGTPGMIMALMMSFHSFLVRGKLWQLWDQKTSSH